MDFTLKNSRIPFIKQQAKLIAINTTGFNKETFGYLCFCFDEYFKMVCSLKDIDKRIPFLTIITFDSNKVEIIQCFSSLFDRYEAIRSFFYRAFHGFKKAYAPSHLSEAPSNEESALVLKKIFDQADELMSLKELFVDVNIFTLNCFFELNNLKKFLETNRVSIQKINKIQIINLKRVDGQSYGENFLDDFLDTSDLSDLIEIIDVYLEQQIIIEHLKLWLQDSNTELEHAQLIFPQNSSYDKGGEFSVIKCDFYDRLLNPIDHFKEGYFLDINQDMTQKNEKSHSKTIKNTNSKLFFTQKLNVLKFVKTEGICESLLYGDPYIVKYSQSNRLKFKELQTNRQNFFMLSNYLKSQRLALLCNLDLSNEEKQKNNAIKTCHYVIFAKNIFDEASLIDPILILKRIATKSILLNDHMFESPAFNELDFSSQNNSRNELEFKNSFVNNIQVIDNYDPLAIEDKI